MEQILLNYSEIGLKGKNKPFFVNKLKGNIVKSCLKQSINLVSIKNDGASLICKVDSKRSDITKCFKSILGIKSFSFTDEIELSVEKLFEKIEEICESLSKKNIKIIFPKTKRSNKNFELKSPDINSKIREIAKKYGIEVDYKDKTNMVYIRVNTKSIYISFEKIQGPAGLPVNTAGRILVLLSGGIDSPVAAYNLMRRGAHCDFLHLHNLKSNKEVLDSKIIKTIKKLNKFQFKSTLYTLPYENFEFGVMGKVVPRYELVIFKYYLLKLAESLAQKYEYFAIANGDSLAQVASQTLENLNIVNLNIDFPIFRPLLTFEKEEIIEISRKIDTFDLSIENYKDCCSLVAKNPMTKAKKDKFLESVNKVNIDKLVEKSLETIELFKI